MRTTAGVFLLLTAIFNFFAGWSYLLGGGMTTFMGHSQEMGEFHQFTIEEERHHPHHGEMEEPLPMLFDEPGSQSPATMTGIGVGLMLFGIVLLASVGLFFAAAILLFRYSPKITFIRFCGALAILIELIALFITGFGILSVIGISAGLLTLLSVRKSVNNQPDEPKSL